MYNDIEIEVLIRDRDRLKKSLYDCNLTLSQIKRKQPDLMLEIQKKRDIEKETIDNLIKFICKNGYRKQLNAAGSL